MTSKPAGGAKVYDRNGTLLYQYVDDREGLRAPVPLDQISPSLVSSNAVNRLVVNPFVAALVKVVNCTPPNRARPSGVAIHR